MSERTRAIVEAAERLAKAAKVEIDTRLGGRGFVVHDAIEIDDFKPDVSRALHDLARALALPEPAWTREAPSEPGDYWVRNTRPGVEREIVYIDDGPAPARVWMLNRATATYSIADTLALGWEWFPVPIQPPESPR